MRRQPRPTVVCRKKLCTTSVSGPTRTLVSVTRLTTYLPVLDACSTNVSQWYLAGAAVSSIGIIVMVGRRRAYLALSHMFPIRWRPLGSNDGRAPRQGGQSHGN